MDDAQERWREQRQRAVAVHAAALAHRQAAEATRARQLIAQFVAEARDRGLADTRLVAQPYQGGPGYRTGLRGWYIHTSRRFAVGVDGEFYLLSVPRSVRARLTGVALTPYQPKLVVGEGGRDGESIPLQTLLRRRLDAGDGWLRRR